MNQLITLIPALFALIVAWGRSPERAFYSVYLPTLLFLPQCYFLAIGGIPKMSFAPWVTVAIFPFALLKIYQYWKLSMMDILVFSYWVCVILSEYHVNGFHTAKSLGFITFFEVVAVYIFAKTLIQQRGLSVSFTKRIVFLMFLTGFIALWEVRFTSNPYLEFFSRFYPGQTHDWPVIFRFGFVRVGGPMIQSILYGMILGVALIMCSWLNKNNLWEKEFRYFFLIQPNFPLFAKKNIILGFLTFIFLITFSRGPLLGMVIGWLTMRIGFVKKRGWYLKLLCLGMILVGIFGVYKYHQLANINLTLAQSDQEATAAYRVILLEKYWDVAMKSPLWGYGAQEWPKLIGLKSIDNQYLWLLLKHGFPATIFFILILFWGMASLLFFGMKQPSEPNLETSFIFMLLGSILSMAIAFLLVYMGMQTGPFLFLLLGWSEGIQNSPLETFRKDLALKPKNEALKG